MAIWAAKIAAKLVLGRIPFRHQVLRGLGMFKHGKMDEASHALKIFNLHKNAAFPEGLPANFTALELGPGDSLASALIAKAYGAKAIYLCDVGHYATRDITKYREMISEFQKADLINTPQLKDINNTSDMLDLCNASYLTNGLTGLKSIPDNSVDFIWSHSVLEHIRKKDFTATMHELHRILKDTGRASHNVDLQDHLEKSLNSLRFSESIWENDIFANSGFYTNRLRCSESLSLMEKAGFKILKQEQGRWGKLPLPQHKMHPDFSHLSAEELRVRTYSVLLKA
jgi:SAM-dependent methyltransferase